MRRNVLVSALVTVMFGLSSSVLAADDPAGDPWYLGDTFRDYEILAMEPTATKADLADGLFAIALFGEHYILRVATAPFFQGPVSVGRLHADGTVTVEPPSFESVVMTGASVDQPDVSALIL